MARHSFWRHAFQTLHATQCPSDTLFMEQWPLHDSIATNTTARNPICMHGASWKHKHKSRAIFIAKGWFTSAIIARKPQLSFLLRMWAWRYRTCSNAVVPQIFIAQGPILVPMRNGSCEIRTTHARRAIFRTPTNRTFTTFTFWWKTQHTRPIFERSRRQLPMLISKKNSLSFNFLFCLSVILHKNRNCLCVFFEQSDLSLIFDFGLALFFMCRLFLFWFVALIHA